MAINPSLPVPGLNDQEVTLSADLESVLYCGMDISTEYFIKVTVPSLLGFYAPGSAGAFKLLTELDANGFSLRAFSNHATQWGHQVMAHAAEVEARRIEAAAHAERIADQNASPEEVAKYRQAQNARRSELANKFGRKAAAFGDL